MAAVSRFDGVERAKPIEVFALIAEYNKDEHADKVNLSVGAYRTDEGKPYVLPVVKTVEAQMAADQTLNHEYLPVAGMVSFRDAAVKLLLGESDAKNLIAGVQTCGGTGALKIAAEVLNKQMGYDTVYVSNPTWGNHKSIFKQSGFSNVKEYRYWDASTRGLDINGMLEDLRNAPQKSVAILHAIAHNPTGVDPSVEEWNAIADVCEEKGLFIVLDVAYQGFTSGNVDTDARVARFLVNRGFEFFAAQSFSKNFGLYNERVGNLCIVTKDADAKTKVLSQCEIAVRTCWSNPPSHGARIVATVLNNPALFAEWKENVKLMAERIKFMREQLLNKLKEVGCPGNWDHIVKQKGMFSYTGLNAQQCDQLKKKYHIYVMSSGRINMCGLTTSNINYVAHAFLDVVSAESKI